MKRINEALAFQPVLAPQSVSASTDKTTAYVDASGAEEVVFLISAAALGANKSLTVTLLASDDSSGSEAKEVGSAKFTDSVGTAPQVAVVTYRPSAPHGRSEGVNFQHDGAAAINCGSRAADDGMLLPASHGWHSVG